MNFFADENINPQMAALLEAFDPRYPVRHLTHQFERGTPDVVWIKDLASREQAWAVIAGDGRILRNKVERLALRQANLTFVHLAPGWMNLKWEEQAWKIIKAWPTIRDEVARASRPTVFQVKVQSKIERVGFTAEL